MRQSSHRGRGFSLIELLVVITIISILAGILFPVFAQARNAAYQTVTMSNIRQIGIASEMYEGDWEDVVPSATDGFPGAYRLGGWVYYTAFDDSFDVSQGALYPYVKNREIYISPADPWSRQRGLSFGLNGCLTTANFVNGQYAGIWSGRPLSIVPEPAITMEFGEESRPEAPEITSTNDGFINPEMDQVSTRWKGGSNVMFVDKHAKNMKVSGRGTALLTGGQAACF